jgi:hypothetical protein
LDLNNNSFHQYEIKEGQLNGPDSGETAAEIPKLITLKSCILCVIMAPLG